MEERTRIGVYGVAETNGQVLLTQLSARDPDPGRWTLPGGGMEFDETPHETLEREFYEETGLTPRIGAVLDVHSFLPRPALHVIQVVYAVQVEGEPRVIEVDGSTVDARWVQTSEVGRLPTVSLVDQLRSARGW